MMRHNKHRQSVYSEHGVQKLLEIDWYWFHGFKYPTFKVLRTDSKEYMFTEVNFPVLNPDDSGRLFNQMKLWDTNIDKDQFAEDVIKRFLTGEVK